MEKVDIKRKKIQQVFEDYMARYNRSSEKIRLKVEHTYRVANLCARIAISEGLTAEDVDLAWVIGMLHDIGRFEQLRQYNTFQDALSIDHGECGGDILFKEGRIRDYILADKEDELIEASIRMHNKYSLPENINKRELLFLRILRDADKIDILRVNVETPLEEIYDVTNEDLKQAIISPAVLDAFTKCHTVHRDLIDTSIDYLVGHIALVYDFSFPMSNTIVREQGFLKQMINFQSENRKTKKDFEMIYAKMRNYI